MATEGNSSDKKAVWLMGLVAGLIFVVAGWYLYANDAKFDRISDKLDSMNTSQTAMASTQSGMQKDIEWIKLGINNIYTEDDAENAHEQIKETTDDLYGKYRSFDERLSILEEQERNR